MRYIDADALHMDIIRRFDYCEDYLEVIDAQPTANVKPVVRGEWIISDKGVRTTIYKCSECGRTVIDDTGYDVKRDYPFCHCGAEMRGEDK